MLESKIISNSDDAMNFHLNKNSIDFLYELSKDIIIQCGRNTHTTSSHRYSSATSSSKCNEYRDKLTSWRRKDKKEDRDDESDDGEDDSKLLIRFRAKAMIAFAIDTETRNIYVGFSGGANSISSRALARAGGGRAADRLDRIRPYFVGVTDLVGYGIYNCAEVSALNVALSRGSHIGNLVFIAMDTAGRIRNPCANCLQWIINHARGYIDSNLTPYLYR